MAMGTLDKTFWERGGDRFHCCFNVLPWGTIWMFPKIGVVNPPKWMVKIMVPNPIEMDEIWGYHDFLGWHPYRIFFPMEESWYCDSKFTFGGKQLYHFSFPVVQCFTCFTLPETNTSPLKSGAPWQRRSLSWKPPFLGANCWLQKVYPFTPHQTQGMNKGLLGIRLCEPSFPLVRLAIKPPAIGGVTSAFFN